MKKLSIAAAALLVTMAAPSQAVVVTSVKITSALPSYLQVAELQIFSGATNVALGGTAIASSTYDTFASPDKAIDGDTNGGYYSANGIFHSQGTSASEYLLVTLAQPTQITSLGIFGRTDCCDARDVYNYQVFNGATVVKSGTLDAYDAAHFAAAVVPEPAAWAMMIGGFGLLGAASRRRRRSVVVTA